MTNQLNNRSAAEHGLPEAAVDKLLKDFFRLEVPQALGPPPARRTPHVTPASMQPANPASRLAIVAALATLAACLLLTTSITPSSPANSGVAGHTRTPNTPQQQLLPVSSNPNTTATAVPVDENGLLLRETEEIRLNPTP